MKLLPIFTLGLLLFAGCSDKDTGTDSDSPDDTADDTGVVTDDTQDSVEPDGAELFATWCASCHGEAGEGTGSGPDIRGELHHDDPFLVSTILNGRGTMNPVALNEDQAAAVVQWMRETF